MKIKREIFEKHKKGIWLIKLKENKYLHIPKPKTILINIWEVFKYILLIPIIIILGACHGIYEGIEQIIFDFNYVKLNFRDIFPNIVDVIEFSDNITHLNIKEKYKK